ncbi:winged helix-turn-helix domain-containing protein [Ensifer sp. 2YAB10]|uniref:winged helix-turn-helix domain-containing protein n=1 Tax=unclassified Ensifer TaxID=2633371 RepID=UPI003F92BF60
MLYVFGEFVLDTDRRELRGSTGLVRVEPQVFDLLEYLLQNRDRVVTRDDLFNSIWKGRIVSDATLSSRISAARSAIGDDGEQQRLIRTLPKKGIRFVAPAREEVGIPIERHQRECAERCVDGTHKIAVILAANIADYARMVRVDEERTLTRLRNLRADLIDPAISGHHGRAVIRTGDGAVFEFPSVEDAVRSAVEVQTGMLERNAGLPSERRFEFRMGIHVGNVVEADDGTLRGEAVGITARLERICEAGCLCLSEDAYHEVQAKLQHGFVDLGERELKDVPRPMRVFSIGTASTTVGSAFGTAPAPLPLPTKPSIAVLPFQNMSGDPDQDYFADGIVEDITTKLARVKSFFVIARNSSFTYKGKAVDVRQVGRELGVRYVVEGSVRRAGSRVRLTGQLIQAETGQHIWADSFDGELADVFDLQDQMTASVVAAVGPSLFQAEIERASNKPTDRLDAYDYYLRALPHFYALTGEGLDRAVALLKEAIGIDANFAVAKAFVARCYAWCSAQGLSLALQEQRETAIRLGREALQDGADDPYVQWMVGFVMWQLRVDPEGALELFDRSLAANANCVQALTFQGQALATTGHLDEAMRPLLKALRLSPFDPEAFFTMSALGCAYMLAARFDEALQWTTRALRARPGFAPALRFHAVCLAELGRPREAHETVEHLLQLEPSVTLDTLRRRVPIYDARLMSAYLDGLRKAGVPE